MPARLTLAILVITLVVFNGTGAFLYVRLKGQMEIELGERLVTLGSWGRTELALGLSSVYLGLADVPWLEEELEVGDTRLSGRLQTFVQRANLERLIVYDTALRVKLDTANAIAINETNPYTVLDQFEIEAALSGVPTATIGYEVEENPFMRAYAPLLTEGGEPVGLLGVEGQRTYFEPLARARNFLLLIGTLVSAALVMLAGLAHHRLRRFVRLEETISHSDRLQTLGTLAAGMAHEIRNPLGIIRITAETLREERRARGDADDDSDHLIDDILEEVDRLHGLVGRFLTFAKPGEHGREEPADIESTVRHTVRLCQKASRGVQIEVEIDAGVNSARTPLPAPSLQQVLFNLLRNAQEAMEAAGQPVKIRVRVSPGPDEGTVEVAVRDEGVGMTPQQVRRAGEPFQSSKPEGTGLGLSISKNLLASAQGRLLVSSARGAGTTASVVLPIHRVRGANSESEESIP